MDLGLVQSPKHKYMTPMCCPISGVFFFLNRLDAYLQREKKTLKCPFLKIIVSRKDKALQMLFFVFPQYDSRHGSLALVVV